MGQQVWVDDDSEGDTFQVFLLTDEALYQRMFDSAEKSRGAEQALLQGTTPATVFGSEAAHIPLIDIKRITADQQDSDLEIDYKSGKEDQDESFSISTEARRDEVYQALKTMSQGRFNEYSDNYNIPRSAFGGLMSLTIFGLITWGLANLAASIQAMEEVEVSGRKQGLKKLFLWMMDLLGPTGISIIGGLICLLLAVYVYARIKSPPHLLILQETPYKPGTHFGTTVKYVILLAVWYWAANLIF